MFFIEHVDHEQTEDDMRATGDVIGAIFSGQRISFDEARQARARQRLRVLPPVIDE